MRLRMKIVIDIPEKAYEAFQEWHKNKVATVEQSIIANGTPLPKGHGDLIDRNVAYDEFDKACLSWEGGLLKYIPTVIPADKEEKE